MRLMQPRLRSPIGSCSEDPSGLFDDPYRQVGGDPHPILTNANTDYIPYGSFGALDPDINSPRVQSWNVTVEQQIGSNWGVAASYLGSYTDRLWNEVALNPGGLPRPWAVHVAGRDVSGLHDQHKSQRAPRLLSLGRESSRRRENRSARLPYGHRQSELPWTETVSAATVRDRYQPERQLHHRAVLWRFHDRWVPECLERLHRS